MTIKERLLIALKENADANGRLDRGALSHVKTRLGLNWHDLSKNLDQLAKEGDVEGLRWTRGERGGNTMLRSVRVPMVAASGPPPEPRGAYVQRVRDWLRLRSDGQEGEWLDLRPAEIDAAVAVGPGQTAINVLTSMERQGEVELRRQPTLGGVKNRISGLRIRTLLPARALRATAEPRPLAIEREAELAPEEAPATPLLDRYAEAKAAAKRLNDNPYISGVTFAPDPMAEEALALRDALVKALDG